MAGKSRAGASRAGASGAGANRAGVSRRLGARGEDAAADYLARVGMRVAERNWRCVLGEIDIVARDGKTIVFVEVKTRKSLTAGSAEEAVGLAKQRQYNRLAAVYLQDHGWLDAEVRFDVIAVTVLSKDRARLRHIRSAYVCSVELE